MAIVGIFENKASNETLHVGLYVLLSYEGKFGGWSSKGQFGWNLVSSLRGETIEPGLCLSSITLRPSRTQGWIKGARAAAPVSIFQGKPSTYVKTFLCCFPIEIVKNRTESLF